MIMSFYTYLRNNLNDCDIQNFIHEYPLIFQHLPDEVMSCKRIKSYIDHDDNNMIKNALFTKIWLDYFKWKLYYDDDDLNLHNYYIGR